MRLALPPTGSFQKPSISRLQPSGFLLRGCAPSCGNPPFLAPFHFPGVPGPVPAQRTRPPPAPGETTAEASVQPGAAHTRAPFLARPRRGPRAAAGTSGALRPRAPRNSARPEASPAVGGACRRPRGALRAPGPGPRFPRRRQSPDRREPGEAGGGRAMPRLRLLLPLLPLLLLLLPPRPGASHAGPPDGAQEPLPGLRERLREAAALSRRYWALLRCRVWPEDCDGDEEARAGPLGWSLPLLGRQYLDILTSWYCSFQDCCGSGDCRISNNLTGLASDLSVRLHGQHLARELVLTAVRGYLEPPQPHKALALSFHGWSGTGKNFVARLLAENLYRDGLRSDCVKVFIATFHFPHPKYVDLYQEQLTSQIRKTQERCPQTLFIFDEAEKLHPGLLEALRSHLEGQAPENHRVESPRTIFLFLSNLGGSVINEAVLNLLMAGWSREDIKLDHLVPQLEAKIAKSTDSGFGQSRLVKENLIDFFVPFLPLEYRHVRLCARDAFLSQELPYTEEALDQIAKMMVYVPKEEQLFSSQGCKSISQRINYFLP
ncbi:torsin-3A [Panthera onca]|uniref:torsin-3A n=1 Tax=Panthera onca TaxID=9690 RepID=UPI002952FCE9|nr:torsin-3A [Panthera onca]